MDSSAPCNARSEAACIFHYRLCSKSREGRSGEQDRAEDKLFLQRRVLFGWVGFLGGMEHAKHAPWTHAASGPRI
jgi:hypothetical protein